MWALSLGIFVASAAVAGADLADQPTGLAAKDASAPERPVQANAAPPQCVIVKSEQPGHAPELVCADEIVVNGASLRGRIIAPVEPIAVLKADDVAALAAFSVSEVLQRLDTTTSSPRGGAPVVLLNGVRISGMEEVQSLPSEAIERIDVLPEEAARAYGYDGSQRVTNVVLKPRFRAVTLEASGGIATDGGRRTRSASTGLTRIVGRSRTSFSAKYEQANMLLESERNVALPVGTGGDMRPWRSLLPETDKLSLQGTIARPVGGVSSSLTAGLELSHTSDLYGLPAVALQVPASSPFAPGGATTTVVRTAGADRVLAGNRTDGKATLGLVSTAGLGDWLLTLKGNLEHGWTSSAVDRGLSAGPLQTLVDAGGDPYQALTAQLAPDLRDDRWASRWTVGEATLDVNTLFGKLPAGPVTLQAMIGLRQRSFRRGSNDPADGDSALSRFKTTGQVFVSLPVSHPQAGLLSFLGKVDVNFYGVIDRFSDAGTYFTGGPGITWQPAKNLTVYFSYLKRPTVPTIEQLRSGVRTIPAVPSFDYLTGQSVLVSQIDGGNPALRTETDFAPAVFVAWQPFRKENLRLTTGYMSFRTRYPIRSFPLPSAEIESAFPERFTRDAEGRLIALDARPINLAYSESVTIQSNITWNKVLGAPPSPSNAAAPTPGTVPPPPSRQAVPTRLMFGLRHTWRLRETIGLAPGIKRLDLLGGDALGRTGGMPAHELKFQGSAARGALTLNLDLAWRSGSTVNLGPALTDRFTFAARGRFDLSLQYDFGKAQSTSPLAWLKGTVLRLDIFNLANSLPQVRDGTGATPPFYQPAYLEPLGRSMTLRLRKQF